MSRFYLRSEFEYRVRQYLSFDPEGREEKFVLERRRILAENCTVSTHILITGLFMTIKLQHATKVNDWMIRKREERIIAGGSF